MEIIEINGNHKNQRKSLKSMEIIELMEIIEINGNHGIDGNPWTGGWKSGTGGRD